MNIEGMKQALDLVGKKVQEHYECGLVDLPIGPHHYVRDVTRSWRGWWLLIEPVCGCGKRWVKACGWEVVGENPASERLSRWMNESTDTADECIRQHQDEPRMRLRDIDPAKDGGDIAAYTITSATKPTEPFWSFSNPPAGHQPADPPNVPKKPIANPARKPRATRKKAAKKAKRNKRTR